MYKLSPQVSQVFSSVLYKPSSSLQGGPPECLFHLCLPWSDARPWIQVFNENESFHHSGHFQVTRDIYTFTACLESSGSSLSFWSIRGQS